MCCEIGLRSQANMKAQRNMIARKAQKLFFGCAIWDKGEIYLLKLRHRLARQFRQMLGWFDG
jgi:hypothetical protein